MVKLLRRFKYGGPDTPYSIIEMKMHELVGQMNAHGIPCTYYLNGAVGRCHIVIDLSETEVKLIKEGKEEIDGGYQDYLDRNKKKEVL